MLPQLRELEERFAETLVVVGVHSAKFSAEGVTANLRQAVLRLGIRHPVVNDSHYQVWDRYAINAWPTTVIVSPDGYVVGSHAGEFVAAQFRTVVEDLLAEADAAGRLNRAPFSWKLEREGEPERLLSFPGKVLADEAGGRLFIADTGHHRIVVTDLDGRVQTVIGRGDPGMEDGIFESASFRDPQGLALAGNVLYVADTGNHAIRRVDLGARTVERVAGTGEQARLARRCGPALETPLNSPWDVAMHRGAVLIAMAGSHQLWSLDLGRDEVRRLVGSGREALFDADLEHAALAQPSGIAVEKESVAFADSESSAIRVADLQRDRVQTIVGEGLFDFGDRDGQGSDVRLQHPLGVEMQGGTLFAADTYNNKIKQLYPTTRASWTWLGTGEAGLRDGAGGQARFWEPGGVSIAAGRLYIADTNNHAIRAAELSTGEVQTVVGG